MLKAGLPTWAGATGVTTLAAAAGLLWFALATWAIGRSLTIGARLPRRDGGGGSGAPDDGGATSGKQRSAVSLSSVLLGRHESLVGGGHTADDLVNVFVLVGIPASPTLYRLARLLTLVRVSACFGACVNYVVCSHLQRRTAVGLVIDRAMAAVIVARLGLIIASSPAPYGAIVSIDAAVECLSAVSLAASVSWCHFGFLQAYIMLIRYRQLEQEGLSLSDQLSAVARSVLRLVLQFLVFVFIFACGLQMAELLGDPSEALAATSFEMTWVNALYMSCVTITTVGYATPRETPFCVCVGEGLACIAHARRSKSRDVTVGFCVCRRKPPEAHANALFITSGVMF